MNSNTQIPNTLDLCDLFWSRRPQVSVCLEGDNAILFDSDTGREKVVNHSGLVVWNALNGQVQIKDIADKLAKQFEQQISDDIVADTAVFANELLNDGFAETSDEPSISPLAEETYSWIHESPKNFDLSITGRCNLGCAYCFYADEMVGRKDLPKQPWLDFFAELKTLGARSLTLSGGEVFMRKDLWELIDAIVDSKMRYNVLSNGTLINEKTIEKFMSGKRFKRLDSIQISIDGSCAEIHDKSRGSGSFQKALKSLLILQKAGFSVSVRVTVNRFNVDDLENIARLLIDDIGLHGFGTNDAMAMGAGCAHQDSITLTPGQRLIAMKTLVMLDERYPGRINASAGSLAEWRMFHEMEHAKATGEKATRWKMGSLSSCGCMYLKLAVHHDGMIAPCNMLASASLGYIGQNSIKDIWLNHDLLKEMRVRRNIPMSDVPGCEGCEWIPYCNGGCPGVIFSQTENMNLANPSSCYRLFIEQTGGFSAID